MIESLYGNFKDVLVMTWPMVFISMVVLVSLRITYLFKNKKEIKLYDEIIMFFFVFYVLTLFQIVTSSDASYGGSNFVPFKEMFRYEVFSKLFYKNVIGNVLLFLPYGYFVSKFISSKSFFMTLLLVFLASISIECTQLSIGRVFDVDDIILNLIGGILGYYLQMFFGKIYEKLPNAFKKELFLNILFSILSVVFIIFLIILLL